MLKIWNDFCAKVDSMTAYGCRNVCAHSTAEHTRLEGISMNQYCLNYYPLITKYYKFTQKASAAFGQTLLHFIIQL